ncbi:MAG: BatD family protein [Methylococcales bacterium]|nr:BatD family protein [Methylococcales bacterium]
MDILPPISFRRALRFSAYFIIAMLMLFMLTPSTSFAADINVTVDRNPVNLDESFQITFSATESPDGEPDFSALEQDFAILNQSQSSSSSWINGHSSKLIQWTVKVMAKQAGNLVIPVIKFGDDASPVDSVVVNEADAKKTINTGEELFMEVEASPEDPVIQSQVFYTLRLYTKVEIAQAKLTEPELADAVVEKLGDDSSYNTELNGVAYSVTERKYAIFPQKSGLLTIKPLVLTAEVLTSGRARFNSFFNSQMTTTKRVESKALTLNVKPVPAAFTGKHWLPAQQLELKQEWSGDVQQMKVGEPLTRTLTLFAKGTTVGLLPELNAASTNSQLKAYPDQPVLQEQKKSDGLIAFRAEKTALIPSQPGNYTLPAIEIPWFNTETQKMEMAKIPETTLTAVSAAGQPTTPPAAAIPAPKTPAANASVIADTHPQETNVWLWVSVFLAMGWIVTVIAFLSKRQQVKPVIDNKAPDVNMSACIKALKMACINNDASAAKQALLAWGRQQFDASNLGSVAEYCDARLRDEILHLNQVLYGKDSSKWQGKRLFQAFTENKARDKTLVSEDKTLEPLYRL